MPITRVKIVKSVVAQEAHGTGDAHLHAGLKVSRTFGHWVDVADLLRQKWKIFGRFDVGYPSYATLLRYYTVPSATKPLRDLDPAPLYSAGHGAVWKEMHEARRGETPDGRIGRAISHATPARWADLSLCVRVEFYCRGGMRSVRTPTPTGRERNLRGEADGGAGGEEGEGRRRALARDARGQGRPPRPEAEGLFPRVQHRRGGGDQGREGAAPAREEDEPRGRRPHPPVHVQSPRH